MRQFLEISMGATGLGAVALLWIKRKVVDIPSLVGRVDEGLLYRVFLALDGSSSEGVRAWAAMGGAAGLPHVVAQARLLLKICVEAAKATGGEPPAAEDHTIAPLALMAICEAGVSVWRSVPRVMASRLGRALSQLAREYEKALTAFDEQPGDAFS